MASLECMDWQGKTISDGMEFYPNKNDACLQCVCEKGYSTMCKTVSCAAPDCPNWKSIPGVCCKFECLDKNGVAIMVDNSTGFPKVDVDVTGTPKDNTVADLGLRLVASTVTTFLILALLLFLIHRFRQRRLLMTLRRYNRRREPLDDLDSISYSPDFFGIQCPPYEDPPPPYTPPKPQPGEEPPPYEAIEGSQGDQRNEGQQGSNNTALSCDQNSNNTNRYIVDRDINNAAVPQQQSRNHSSNLSSNLNGNINGRGNTNVSTNGICNSGTNRESVRIQREISDRNISCRIDNNCLQQNCGNVQTVGDTDVSDGNLLSVHFRNNPFGQPGITMGVQNRNRNNRNRYSDGNFNNANSSRNMAGRNAVNANTAALNLELQNTVRNFRNRGFQTSHRHSAPNAGDLSSSTTDIGESTTSAESLSSSPESPHCHMETESPDGLSPDILADDANSTVKRFLDRQFGPLPKNRRYPTTMSQSWTSTQVSPTGQNFRQSISLGSFPPKPEFQTAQKSLCMSSTANCVGNRNLPRSKSEHLKTNGSLINQPYKSPTRNMPHPGHAARVAYKEPEEFNHRHVHNRVFCDLNFQSQDACDGLDSNASVCSGQVGSGSSRLTAAILDPGDIIVTRRNEELRKLRLSHLLHKQTCPLDGTNMDSFSYIGNPRQIHRSFSENSVNSLSVCSETGERNGAGVAISNDAQYPTSSYKNFQQPVTKSRSDQSDSAPSQQSSPRQQGSQSRQLRQSQKASPLHSLPTDQHLPSNEVENTQCKDVVRDQMTSSSNSEVSSCKSTPKRKNDSVETKRKLPDISMIHSWHGGQFDSCDDNISLGRFSMNTLVRNVNRNFEKKTCVDKDVSNMFFPYYKPCNTDLEIDKNCVPSSEMRACASQLYNYETEERQGKKSKKKQIFKRHSAGCIPVPTTEHKNNSPDTAHKQYLRLKSSRSNERQSSQRVVLENSSKDHSRKRVSSRDRKSCKKLLNSGKDSNPKVTDLTPSHLVQSHVASGRPSSLNVYKNENLGLSDLTSLNNPVTCGKKRSKSLGRGDVNSSTRSRGSQSRKKKRQSVPAAHPFQEELEHALQRHVSHVKTNMPRCPKNGFDRNPGAIAQV